MRVRDIMSSPATTCATTDSLQTAAQLLWEHDCGILPVVDGDGRLGAVITDRDVCMAAYTRGQPLQALRVADSMSKLLVTCNADDRITAATRVMIKHAVRRLPVIGADGRVAGVLSLNDLTRAAAKDAGIGREALEVLTAVCRPHAARVPTAPMQNPGASPMVVPAPAKTAAPVGP